MYYYIIDPENLNQRQFERVQNQLYSCLSDYRVSGEVSRVTTLRPVNQLVDAAFARGVKTLVAVGNDETLFDVINAVKNRDVVVGFIPIYDCESAQVLGLSSIEQACKVIAARRILSLDLGQIGEQMFLTKLSFGVNLTYANPFSIKLIKQLFELPTFDVKFTTKQYSAALKVVGGQIINSRGSNCANQYLGNPQDAVLDVLLLPKLARMQIIKHRKDIVSGCYENIQDSSIVHVSEIELLAPQAMPLLVGKRIIAKTPAVISIKPKAMKFITGKERKF